ncbi:hypothetical protein GCM10023238_21150 [Streptomyces heliomycini]
MVRHLRLRAGARHLEEPGLAGQAGEGKLTAIALMLLLAACGKSAQVPLQSWLGDAMEGPTPVSALIHAATMVTAGVYLIVRSAAVFNGAPDGTAGRHRRRRGHAAVRCDRRLREGRHQEGAGRLDHVADRLHGARRRPRPHRYVFAIMHLGDARLLQAGLFLGAGSVMHGMNDEVDMRRYGGLRKYMPVTFVTFGLGYPRDHRLPGPVRLLLQGQDHRVGVRPRGGAEGWILGACALLGAAITAYYMTRVMLMTFFGEERWRNAPTPSPAEPDVEPAAETRGAYTPRRTRTSPRRS